MIDSDPVGTEVADPGGGGSPVTVTRIRAGAPVYLTGMPTVTTPTT